MSIRGIGQDIVFLLIVTALVSAAGTYLALVFTGGRTWLDPIAGPVERALYRLARVDAALEMTWAEYATAFVIFGLVGTLVLYAILREQAPLATPLTPDLAANTAISFSTTTTWQAYSGETTMRYATQLVGLAGQDFLAGAAGLAVGIAFIRGLAGDGATAERRGTMEGKEVRFGVDGSVLTAVTTSNGATGSTNAADDSLTPLGGAVALVNMLLGEIAFGGLGSGLYSIVMIALLGLFLTGLMIGRTPQYLGKPLGGREVRLVVLYTLVMPLVVLPLTALAVLTPLGLSGLTTNTGPHGLTEIWFAYASAFANNGQAFAGLNANTPFYNVTTAVAIMPGRFALGIIALALGGTLGRARRRATAGAVPTDTVLFGVVIIGTAFIVGALTYSPALVLVRSSNRRAWSPT